MWHSYRRYHGQPSGGSQCVRTCRICPSQAQGSVFDVRDFEFRAGAADDGGGTSGAGGGATAPGCAFTGAWRSAMGGTTGSRCMGAGRATDTGRSAELGCGGAGLGCGAVTGGFTGLGCGAMIGGPTGRCCCAVTCWSVGSMGGSWVGTVNFAVVTPTSTPRIAALATRAIAALRRLTTGSPKAR